MLDDQTFILDAFGAIRVGNRVVCLGISSRLISEQNLHINRIQWLDPNSAITPDGETGRAQKHNKTTATTTKNIGGGGGGGGGGDTIVGQEKMGEKKISETEQGSEHSCRINKQGS